MFRPSDVRDTVVGDCLMFTRVRSAIPTAGGVASVAGTSMSGADRERSMSEAGL